MNHTLIIIALIITQDPRNAPCVNGNCPIQNNNQNNQQINLPLRARDDTIGASRLDFKYIDQQVHSLKTCISTGSKTPLEYALTCKDARLRAAANLVAADYGTEFMPDLIKNITDDDIAVQQTARQSLVRLARKAYNITAPIQTLTGPKEPIDFGPMASDNNTQTSTSQTMWELWHRALKPENITNINKPKDLQVNIKGAQPKPK
jgi:hypothetical protein